MANYYKILNVNRTASNLQIRQAYMKLALKWHPDRNPNNVDEANRRFKEISFAYQILSDERKRRVYDRYGIKALFDNDNEDSVDKDDLADEDNDSYDEDIDSLFDEDNDSSDEDYDFGYTSFPFAFQSAMETFIEFLRSNSNQSGHLITTLIEKNDVTNRETVTITKTANGKVTEKTYENGVLKKKTVNGVSQFFP